MLVHVRDRPRDFSQNICFFCHPELSYFAKLVQVQLAEFQYYQGASGGSKCAKPEDFHNVLMTLAFFQGFHLPIEVLGDIIGSVMLSGG